MYAEVTAALLQAMTWINWFKTVKNEFLKGGIDMPENKNMKKEEKPKEQKPITKPGDIKGKIEIPDTRERKDGPGGN